MEKGGGGTFSSAAIFRFKYMYFCPSRLGKDMVLVKNKKANAFKTRRI